VQHKKQDDALCRTELPNVQVSDTTGDDSSNTVDYQKLYYAVTNHAIL